MNIKSLFLAAAMAVGAAAANGATLDQVEVVTGGPTIIDSGQVGYFPGLGGSVTGRANGSGSTLPLDSLLLTADFLGASNQFSAISIGPILPGPYLSGTFEDAADDDGSITVLYSTTSGPLAGSAASDFGAFFRLTIADASIMDGVLTSGVPAFFASASLTVEAVSQTTPIPLPASGILLMAATGGLMALRRRKSRAEV